MAAFVAIAIIVVIVAVVVGASRRSSKTEVSPRRQSNDFAGSTQAAPAVSRPARVDTRVSEVRRAPNVATPHEPLRWFGPGETVHVHGFEVRNPLTYVGSLGQPGSQGRAIDPSQVDRALRIEAAGDAPPLPYWPWYAEMEPRQRYVYLKWLATDRSSLPPSDGYLFVYYYGLERRALADGVDHELVFAEVQRLRSMHAAQSQSRSRSFQNYSSSFLWYLVAVHGARLQPEHVKALVRSTHSWTEDSLAAALAWFANRQYPLRPWMAYVLAQESPLSQRSVVVRRVSDEFEKLFAQRVEAEFGKGMLLRASKRDRQIMYRPASAALQPASASVANPLGFQSQFRRFSEIWNDCIAELRKLSSVAKDGLPDTLTPEAWEAMPAELRAGVDHPHSATICSLVTSRTDETGHTFIPIGEFATTLGIESRAKLTAKQSRSVANTVQHAGFALEPDVRLSGRNYDWDDLVAVFPHVYEGEPDHRRYGGAACILRLGVEIAEADGRVDEQELARVMGQIEAGFQLNEHERRRLEALRALLTKTGSDVAGLGKRLQAIMDADGRSALGRLLVAVAGIDGVISKGELTALRRCYRALDLPPDSLESTIAELAPAADEAPVPVVTGLARTAGERIPAPPSEEGSVKLDRARIMSIMEETREVSMLLAEAMRAEAEQAGGPQLDADRTAVSPQTAIAPTRLEAISHAQPASAAPGNVADGPPVRYRALYSVLVSKERWPLSEAEALARQHGHMLSGALEAVNDWAFERAGGQLIYEDGDCIVVEKVLLESLAS
ncbi:MAG: TerB N-terminal domain-containing protein [Phycisphaerae bacterium]